MRRERKGRSGVKRGRENDRKGGEGRRGGKVQI